jgi:hypothetical protein
MKQSVTFSAFVDAFHAYKRFDQFGYEALRIIFDYLEEYEANTQEIELDVIAICCEYTVQGHIGIAQDYSIDLSEADGDCDEEERIVLDYLNDHTMVLGVCSTGIVYQCF